MKKLSAVVVALGFLLSGSAFAQATGMDQAIDNLTYQLNSTLKTMAQQLDRHENAIRNQVQGSLRCDWQGARWVSHGWDNACAFRTGVFIECVNGVVVNIRQEVDPNCRLQR